MQRPDGERIRRKDASHRPRRGTMGSGATRFVRDLPSPRAAVIGRRLPVIRKYSDRQTGPPVRISMRPARVTTWLAGLPSADPATVGSARYRSR